jgi:hypothetical protein
MNSRPRRSAASHACCCAGCVSTLRLHQRSPARNQNAALSLSDTAAQTRIATVAMLALCVGKYNYRQTCRRRKEARQCPRVTGGQKFCQIGNTDSAGTRIRGRNPKGENRQRGRSRKKHSGLAPFKCPVRGPFRAALSVERCCNPSVTRLVNVPSAPSNFIPVNSAPISTPPAALSAHNPFQNEFLAKTSATDVRFIRFA